MAFDPERHIARLAPLGAALVVVGIALNRVWSYPFAVVGALLLFLSCRSAEDGFLVVGPFVKQEMISLVRRSWFYAWRALALTLGVAAMLTAAGVRLYYASPAAVQISGTVLVVATGYICLLVVLPSGTQLLLGAISGEREAKRLDFLLVTDLRNREIVIGRTVSRLLPLFAHLSVLLPFAAAVSPLFGLPMSLVVVPAAYVLVTFFATCGLTVFGSTMAPTVKRTNPYVGMIVFPFALGTGLIDLVRFRPEIWGALFTVPGVGLVAVGDVLEYISAANPIGIVVKVVTEFAGGGDGLQMAIDWLPIYAAYQLAFGFLGFFTAIRKLRTTSAKLAGQGPAGSTDAGGRQIEKPTVTDRPILWKERHFHELLPKTKKALWLYRILGFCLSYVPGIAVIVIGVWGEPRLQDATRGLLTGALPLIAWIMLCLGIRVSAGAIARERERDTLTSLVVTPLPPAEIVREKWLGSFGAQLGGIVWILVLGVPAVLTGLYPWYAFAPLLLLTMSFIAVGTSIGVLASITAPKTEKANQQAVLRGLLGIVIQLGLAIAPLILAGMKLFSYGMHTAVAICPILSLVLAGFAGISKEVNAAEIVVTGSLATVHMLVTAWFVYRRAVAKFTAMCDDGTIDTGIAK
jgi:ABC-type Na+ efflux pump permease subunit